MGRSDRCGGMCVFFPASPWSMSRSALSDYVVRTSDGLGKTSSAGDLRYIVWSSGIWVHKSVKMTCTSGRGWSTGEDYSYATLMCRPGESFPGVLAGSGCQMKWCTATSRDVVCPGGAAVDSFLLVNPDPEVSCPLYGGVRIV